MLATALATSVFVASAFAHGGVSVYTIGGTAYKGWSPYNPAAGQVSVQRAWPSYDPILTSTGANIRCNGVTSSTVPAGAQLSATIAAGQTIKATWAQWTHAEGPVTVYLAKCPGACKDWDGSGKAWFKIDEAGLLSGTVGKGRWGNTVVLETLEWTSTIPASLAPGEYLIRHEVLALHQANAPQFYPECAQLTITGSGTESPSSAYLVSFPGAFSDSDAGVNVNIYSNEAQTQTSYPVPGPPVWRGNSGTPPPTTSASPATSTSTSRSSSSAPATSTQGGAALWGQCGGTGWTGPTTCASGTCKKLNDFYSQCTP